MFIPTKITLVAAALLAPMTAAATEAAPLEVEVLDHQVLGESQIDGLDFAEISALAYDADQAKLYGLSDTALLFDIDFAHEDGQITRLEPLTGVALTDAQGTALKPRDFNPEGAYLDPDGKGVVVVSENGPQAALFDLTGRWLEEVALPQALRDDSLQRSRKDGLESLALHPTHGILSAPEEPHEAEAREHHSIHAGDGAVFAYDTDDATGRTNIKSLLVDESGRLLILERHNDKEIDALQPYLRLLDPQACPVQDGSQPCPTTVAKITLPDITDADFEGLTQVGPDLYLMVSDDKIDGAQRLVWALLRVTTD